MATEGPRAIVLLGLRIHRLVARQAAARTEQGLLTEVLEDRPGVVGEPERLALGDDAS